ncbi:MAG TPA: carboxyl transferase domain-containing protein [Dehalococcoidia bacterium]|nr:carboxyl transferase domain-containing protein [Dehalococcoidia bacterium]
MLPRSLLVANRGEIAIRVLRAASELGIRTVAVYSEDDAESLHLRQADEAWPLRGAGVRAYLDIEQMVAAAKETGCEAVHPGYGFLSENAAFARRLREEGITFVGPRVEILELFGDKVRALEAAARAGVPVLPGTSGPTSAEQAREFFASLPPGEAMIIKAIGGGGGRGMRVIESLDGLEEALARCRAEAQAAFGNGDVYVERLVRQARHIEVQIVGDGSGAATHLWERDCSIQRRHQKLVEIAPSPGLSAEVRQRIHAAAVRLAEAVKYDNVGTFEFLVDASDPSDSAFFAFIEANPRLQVEHTVTEEVTGIDIVRVQLELAGGAHLASLGLLQPDIPQPRGYAIQVRVNMETMKPDGTAMPSAGVLSAFQPPSGPGIRVDTFGYAGYKTSPRYDSLLAKVIAHTPRASFEEAVARCYRALTEFRLQGVNTNIPFLLSILSDPGFKAGRLYTRFIDDHLPALLEGGAAHPMRYADGAKLEAAAPAAEGASPGGAPASGQAGVKVDPNDPLAVLKYGKAAAEAARPQAPASPPGASPAAVAAPEGTVAVTTPLQGTVVSIEVAVGAHVRKGQVLAVMESMKMQHEVRAEVGGIVRRIAVAPGDTLYQGHAMLFIEETATGAAEVSLEEDYDLDEVRPDLKAVLDRRAYIYDENRPKAVASRAAKGQRTARANVMDLIDPGTWVEYGPLVVANQHSRRTMQDLIENTPADGMIIGIGNVNGHLFDEPASRVAVICYDYTVLAGTQGGRNHRKTDRMIDVAEEARLPVVLFAEGGGGRPGDDASGGGGSITFARFPQLSGLVPLVGITSGRCFAGNASVLGCCDVIIATENSNIGMGGPAMIEGGGLGVFAPEEIGPMSVQVPNGVVDIAVKDEAEAVQVAKKYLSYFQGRLKDWEAPDQRLMRRIIPENRLRVYDVRKVIHTLADVGSVLELRPNFGVGMITALIRVEGRPLGVIANNPMHLGGAIDSDGADKGARFMQLCDAFDLPVLYFCDTPGIMVGPEIEKTALVRHSSRMFLIGANLSVPFFTVVLRKAYGLGAIAMAGGSYRMPMFTVAWPTGEFGGMGLEGSVKLGYRRELEAIEDPAERMREYERRVAAAYERGKAVNNATSFGIDDAIDPAETRFWVASLLRSLRPPPPREGKKRPAIDAW